MGMEWSGAVLAGGQSRRFGQDKARYCYRGRPLLEWVLEGLGQASERFVVANQAYPVAVPIYPDLRPGGDTLSGLHTALARARCEWVAVAACDQPFLQQGYWRFILKRIQPEAQAVVAASEGFLEPLGGLYHKSLEAEVARRLEAGQLGLQALLRSIPHVAVPKAELEGRFGPQLFLNANHPQDLP